MGCNDHLAKLKTGKEGQVLPRVNLLLMDSTTQINTSNIPIGKPIVIFLFSPYCPYCQAQTREIIDKQAELSEIRFYMVSAFPISTLKEYYKMFNLEKYPNITVAQDKQGFFRTYLNPPGFPYQAIYGRDKKLLYAFLGIVKLDNIKDFISQ
ncbi:hypothetical protein A4H97_29865 [Niastella yeongjuensis]|uniref:Thioredoxin domain-containing protein n=2 Tax=Niastella yeongjuensis TaxID=354355 RepID=A0A1V9EQ86_9BACT|nr:hypothetical protein A4H97_29865 [Niastella yeongjuensis]